MTIETIDTPIAYDDFIERLQEALRIRDGASWIIGDELIGSESIYGERTIETIADDCGASPSSLYSYVQMSAFYPPLIRWHYVNRGLMFTHMRAAKSLGNLTRACEFLNDCLTLKWPPRYAEMEARKQRGQTVQPPAVYRGIAHVVHGALVCEDFVFQEGRVYVIQVRETL